VPPAEALVDRRRAVVGGSLGADMPRDQASRAGRAGSPSTCGASPGARRFVTEP
jgi:hypothetical protein